MNNEKYRFGVIGSGSWATAIVKILSENLNNINWWIRSLDTLAELKKNGKNPKYLTSIKFDKSKICPSNDIQEVIDNSDIIIMAIPSIHIKKTFESKKIKHLNKKFFITATKGIIPETLEIPSNYFRNTFNIDLNNLGMIAGPCHAEEVALERLSYLTISSINRELRKNIAELLACPYIYTSTSKDFETTELCAIIKNIYAICSGICDGLGFGDNFQAVLISNAVRECQHFLSKINPQFKNINNTNRIGDILVTSYSQFSRNRNFGLMVGKGYSVHSARLEMNMVAEGFNACKGIYKINETLNAKIPIIDCVYNILHENISPIVEVKILTSKLK